MKIVYISHPIGGDVPGNLEKIRRIIRDLNLSYPEMVPFAPYYSDVVSLDDAIPDQRERGLRNDIALIERGFIDEMWLFGPTISAGMRLEMIAAWNTKIPVIATHDKLWQEMETIRRNYDKQP